LPEITTIIPTYRRPQLVGRAIRSVLAQRVRDFQLCVYDNASGDETETVVQAIAARDPRVAYFRHDSDVGAMQNFLHGMQRVETPFFSFLSDDDVLLPNFFEVALAGFARYPDALLFAASTIEVNAEGALRFAPLSRWPREGRFAPPDGAFAMLGNRHPTWTTVLFRREALSRIGYLNVAVGAPADLDYELRVAAVAPIAVSYTPCGAYVAHESSGSMSETVEVVHGFDVMRETLAADERIAPDARRRLHRLLGRQIRGKLLEIWVKSLVRGRDAEARRAAALMRDRYGLRAGGAALAAYGAACERWGFLRSVLQAAEAWRLRARARSSGPHADASTRDAIRALLCGKNAGAVLERPD
jgi:glycosyltransferase involved in cell wall biosynthesis